jgi:hypothetical protein
MSTITGSGSGQVVVTTVSNILQQVIAQNILNAAAATIASGSATVSSQYTIDPVTGGTILGNPTGPSPQYTLLAGGSQTYATNGAPASFVVGTDPGNNTIINDSGSSALVGITGAGPNNLIAAAGSAATAFYTGAGGVDQVTLDSSANSLSSNGVDNVNVGGSATISAGSTAVDNILLQPGVTLDYTNGSKSIDTVTATSSDTVIIAGPGSTSVNGLGGANAFYVDTSVGNVTLNANGSTTDAFNFVKDATSASAAVTVSNFGAGDTVNITGYSGAIYSLAPNVSGSAVLSLSDGSTVTFAGVSTATVQAAIKTAT